MRAYPRYTVAVVKQGHAVSKHEFNASSEDNSWIAGIKFQLPEGAAPFVAAIVMAALVFYFIWYFPRARSLVRHWAIRNGFELLELEHRWLFTGPFFWNHSRNQSIFRVRVRDRNGGLRLGWVRCGGFFTGVFTDEASVIWDEDRNG